MSRLIFCILLFSIQSLSAQNEEGDTLHAIKHKYSSNYRVNYFDKMIFKIDLNSDVDSYTIPNLNKKIKEKNTFVPNQKIKLRFSFDYKFIGLFVSFSPNFFTSDKSIYGDTKSLDLSFKYFYNDKFRQEVVYKNTIGFYLDDPKEFLPIVTYPNLEINTLGGKTLYIINNNFSYRSYENMTERQIKNIGSFIPSIAYYFNTLKTNAIIENEKTLTKIKTVDILFQYGYMYNFVLSKKWFATLGVHPGFGLNKSKSYYFSNGLNQKKIYNSFNMNLNFDANLALGYNNKNLFSGVKVNYREYQYDKAKTIELINTKLSFDFFIGYRFKENKKLKRNFELFEKKFL